MIPHSCRPVWWECGRGECKWAERSSGQGLLPAGGRRETLVVMAAVAPPISGSSQTAGELCPNSAQWWQATRSINRPLRAGPRAAARCTVLHCTALVPGSILAELVPALFVRPPTRHQR